MPPNKRVTITDLRERARSGRKISMLALYDFPFASLAEQAGLDGIIIGDSVMMTLYGEKNTLGATMDMMIAHTRAVRRGAPNLFLVGDMPYLGVEPDVELVVRNAHRFVTEADADAVKLEGGAPIVDQVKALIEAGISVVGHLGVLPQSAALSGGVRRVEAREAQGAFQLVEDAIMLDQLGASLLILEAVPSAVAEEVVKRVSAPVIGIGAGPPCDGQVLLAYDILGLFPQFKPKFVQRYAELAPVIVDAFSRYVEQTRSGEFPGPQHCYAMKDNEREEFLKILTRLDGSNDSTTG